MRCRFDTPGGPAQRVFKEVMKVDSGKVSAEIVGDRLRAVVKIDGRFRDALLGQPKQRPFQQGPTDNRCHRLWAGECQRSKPRPFSSGQNHGFHGFIIARRLTNS